MDPKSASAERRDEGRSLRVGGIDYLNAQPLIHSLLDHASVADRELPLEVSLHRPRVLAELLGTGNLDVALVPVVACFDPGRDWRIVPGLSIASWGPVRSIRLYHRAPLERVTRVALDASSRTSVVLTRLLFIERWGARPAFESVEPGRLRSEILGVELDSEYDAVLLIGDDALSCGRYPGWEEVDLGSEWTGWTGLPFVYAVWAARDFGNAEESIGAALTERLLDARWRGFARIDEIVAHGRRPAGLGEAECRDYLVRTIRYDLGREELEGLELFVRRSRAAGLLASDTELRFLAPPLARIG